MSSQHTHKPSSWVPGRTLVAARYRLDALLSAGGMGVVYRAFDLETQRDVAIKILRREHSQNVVAKHRFLREAHLLGRFREERFPRLLDVGECGEDQLFQVLELLEGSDLRRVLGLRSFTPEEAAEIVLQLAHALARVHDAGVVHRDIKPENVMFASRSGRETVKLIDFGIAQEGCFQLASTRVDLMAVSPRETDKALGSPQYMAPEQGIDAALVDQRADIWSLGILLFELLTGNPPGRPSVAWRDWSVPQLPPSFPAQLRGVLHGCLQVDPERRFTTARQLAAALAAYLAERTPATGSAGAVESSPDSVPCKTDKADHPSGVFPKVGATDRPRPISRAVQPSEHITLMEAECASIAPVTRYGRAASVEREHVSFTHSVNAGFRSVWALDSE